MDDPIEVDLPPCMAPRYRAPHTTVLRKPLDRLARSCLRWSDDEEIETGSSIRVPNCTASTPPLPDEPADRLDLRRRGEGKVD